MKYNKNQRRMMALLRIYRETTPLFLEWLRKLGSNPNLMAVDVGRAPRNRAIELHALESVLPPEMVAWAKLNR